MKTKELIKLVDQLEALYVKDHGDKLGFYEVGSDNPYFILPKSAEKFDDGKTNLRCISKAKLEMLLDVGDHIVGYLNTPLAEREEEKRYRLLSVSPMLRKSECGYLLYHKEYDKYYTGDTDHWGLVYQSIFTESEIAEMDIAGFEKIRVIE